MARNPMVDSLVQSVWLQMARNPMADSPVQSAWLQTAGNPVADSPVLSCVTISFYTVSYTHLTLPTIYSV